METDIKSNIFSHKKKKSEKQKKAIDESKMINLLKKLASQSVQFEATMDSGKSLMGFSVSSSVDDVTADAASVVNMNQINITENISNNINKNVVMMSALEAPNPESGTDIDIAIDTGIQCESDVIPITSDSRQQQIVKNVAISTLERVPEQDNNTDVVVVFDDDDEPAETTTNNSQLQQLLLARGNGDMDAYNRINETRPGGKGILGCRYCNRSFKYVGNLNVHVRVDHKSIRSQCPICFKLYTRNVRARQHMFKKHKHIIQMQTDIITPIQIQLNNFPSDKNHLEHVPNQKILNRNILSPMDEGQLINPFSLPSLMDLIEKFFEK